MSAVQTTHLTNACCIHFFRVGTAIMCKFTEIIIETENLLISKEFHQIIYISKNPDILYSKNTSKTEQVSRHSIKQG